MLSAGLDPRRRRALAALAGLTLAAHLLLIGSAEFSVPASPPPAPSAVMVRTLPAPVVPRPEVPPAANVSAAPAEAPAGPPTKPQARREAAAPVAVAQPVTSG